MQVTVRYLATHKELAGTGREVLDVPEGTTVADLMDRLLAIHPSLKDLRRDTIVSVNRGLGTDEIVLGEGDDVALFPPIEGG